MTTVLKNKDVYHVNNAIKLGQYNVGREGDILRYTHHSAIHGISC